MDEITQTRFGASKPRPPNDTLLRADLGRPGDAGDGIDPSAQFLWQHLGKLQRQIQRALLLDVISVATSWLLLLFTAFALLDWWIRPSDPVGRAALFGCLIAGGVAVVGWFYLRQRRRRITRLAVARRLEEVCPWLGDRLSSAVALLQSQVTTAGDDTGVRVRQVANNELSSAAIQLASVELSRSTDKHRVDWQPAIQSFVWALVLICLLVLAFVWRPASASIAARRLLDPTSSAEWPKQDELVLENVPEKVHSGQEIQVFVRDQIGTLPNDVEVLVRNSDGLITSPALTVTGAAAQVTIAADTDDFEIRARGGDDESMDWQRVQVVSAPFITNYQLVLTPPDYVGQASFETKESEFKVLQGTAMTLTAAISQPVSSASLLMIDAAGEPQRLPMRVTADGTDLQIADVMLESNTKASIEWVDLNGLIGISDRSWKIIVETDSSPRVVITRPENDIELTAVAVLELVGRGQDDIGIVEQWLEIQHVQTASIGRVGVIEDQQGSVEGPRMAAEVLSRWNGTVGELFGAINSADEAAATELAGTSFEVTAVALDTAGQRGISAVRRIRIISRDDMQFAIDAQQSKALQALQEGKTQQEIALEQTEAALARIGEDENARQNAADRIQAASTAQQATNRSIADGNDSAISQLRRAQKLARDNALNSSKLDSLLDRVEEISQQALPNASSSLKDASSALAGGQPSEAESKLSSAAQNQRESLQQLNELIGSMQKADAQRAAGDSLSELSAAQARLMEQTRQAGSATDPSDERERLSERQRDLARQAQQLADQLRDLAQSSGVATEDHDAAEDAAGAGASERARQALQALRPDGTADSPVEDKMREAASELARGREGRSESLQAEAREQLEQARKILNGSPPSEQPNSLADQLEKDQARSQAFAIGVQQSLLRQNRLVEQLQNESQWEVASLAGEQADIAAFTGELIENTNVPMGFDVAISDAVREMNTATELLRRDAERQAALESASSARERIRIIAESLLESENNEVTGQNQEAPRTDQPAESSEPERDTSIPLETLRLLRATQEMLRIRTEDIIAKQEEADVRADPVRTVSLEAMRRQLAEEQRRLVEQIEQYASEIGIEE